VIRRSTLSVANIFFGSELDAFKTLPSIPIESKKVGSLDDLKKYSKNLRPAHCHYVLQIPPKSDHISHEDASANTEFYRSVAVLLSAPGKIDIITFCMQESMSIRCYTAPGRNIYEWVKDHRRTRSGDLGASSGNIVTRAPTACVARCFRNRRTHYGNSVPCWSLLCE
jgi:hypothetical protein